MEQPATLRTFTPTGGYTSMTARLRDLFAYRELIYNLVVLMAEIGVEPDEIWDEMARREAKMGLAAKLAKSNGS